MFWEVTSDGARLSSKAKRKAKRPLGCLWLPFAFLLFMPVQRFAASLEYSPRFPLYRAWGKFNNRLWPNRENGVEITLSLPSLGIGIDAWRNGIFWEGISAFVLDNGERVA
jgi:hypothetical protein